MIISTKGKPTSKLKRFLQWSDVPEDNVYQNTCPPCSPVDEVDRVDSGGQDNDGCSAGPSICR